jgi:hypothetical protein
MNKFGNHGSKKSVKQEILGRTSSLLTFDTTRTAYKTTPPTILCCHGNVFTEFLPSSDGGDTHTDTRVQQFFHCCVYSLPRERVYLAMYIPNFIKIGSGIQKLKVGNHRYTEGMEIAWAYFRKVS